MKTTAPKKSTKKKLLQSAAVIFTEKGYPNTSIAEICKMAGANIASVNYHFHSKDALYRAVLHYTFAQAESLYPADLAEDTPAEEQFYQTILLFLRAIFNREMKGNFYILAAREMSEPTTASKDIIHDIVIQKRTIIYNLIKEIYQGGNSKVISLLTYSVISQCLFMSHNEKGRTHHIRRPFINLDDVASVARHITNFSLAGIRYYQDLAGIVP